PPVAIGLSLVLLIVVLVVAPRIAPSISTLEPEAILRHNQPRTVLAAILGAALAAAGVVLQAVLRNPLATPYTLGISSGAALGAAAMIKLGTHSALAALSVGVPRSEPAALAGALASDGLV